MISALPSALKTVLFILDSSDKKLSFETIRVKLNHNSFSDYD